jgi:hypothetical protein
MTVANANTTQPLPPLSEPAVDRYRKWTPAWWRFIKPLLESTNRNSEQLVAVSADLTAAQAAITTEATVRAAADGALASDITTLETTVNGVSATVTQHSESIDGIEARWGVAVNINNRVTGQIRLDGLASGTTFSVLADKFIIVHPTVDATEIQAFITGLVNGVSTVGINGNLVVDGTILARHIDVTSLSAIVADVGTITAGVLQSSDGKMVIDLNNKSIRMEI